MAWARFARIGFGDTSEHFYRDLATIPAAVSFLRGFLPRPVRRAMHPVRSTAGSIKRRATPRPIRKAFYIAHPVGTATTSAGRSTRRALGGKKGKSRSRARVYHHGTCTVNHRTPEAAAKCRRTY
jgi:hypothetical protein